MRIQILAASVLTALLTTATPALAKERKKPQDPNRVICRTEGEIGSRLNTKRTCLTAMQWVDLEREQRQTVEKVQAFKPVNGG